MSHYNSTVSLTQGQPCLIGFSIKWLVEESKILNEVSSTGYRPMPHHATGLKSFVGRCREDSEGKRRMNATKSERATPSLTHVALHVPVVAESIAFFEAYCGMRVTLDRPTSDGTGSVVWMAEPGRERELVVVLIPDGTARRQADNDYSHLGFAVGSREEVDALAERASGQGCLMWEPTDEAYPVGYYCGVRAPDGTCVEFSYGQPLGMGSDNHLE